MHFWSPIGVTQEHPNTMIPKFLQCFSCRVIRTNLMREFSGVLLEIGDFQDCKTGIPGLLPFLHRRDDHNGYENSGGDFHKTSLRQDLDTRRTAFQSESVEGLRQ